MIPRAGSPGYGKRPPAKKPSGISTLAPSKHHEARRWCASPQCGTRVRVQLKARLTRPSSVPCVCAKVSINRRVSLSASRYHPALKPCMTSNAIPSDRNTNSCHQPKQRCSLARSIARSCALLGAGAGDWLSDILDYSGIRMGVSSRDSVRRRRKSASGSCAVSSKIRSCCFDPGGLSSAHFRRAAA